MITSVIIDSREPDWVQNLTFGGVPTAVTALEAGDFLVATADNCMLGIERKTSDDLLNTLKGDRLFSQVSRLRETTPWAYLLITGYLGPGPDGKTITSRQTGWDYSAVQGALLTVQELGVNVVLSPGDHDLENSIIRLAKRERGQVRITPSRIPNFLGPGEAAIAALPGIGMERLEAVIRAAGSPAWALVMLTEHHGEHVPGVGPATKASIRRALGLDDDLEFVILPIGTEVRTEAEHVK